MCKCLLPVLVIAIPFRKLSSTKCQLEYFDSLILNIKTTILIKKPIKGYKHKYENAKHLFTLITVYSNQYYNVVIVELCT